MFIETKHIKDYTYYYLAHTFRAGSKVKKARIFIGPKKIISTNSVSPKYHRLLKKKIIELKENEK